MSFSLQMAIFKAKRIGKTELTLSMEEAQELVNQQKANSEQMAEIFELLPEEEQERLAEEMWGEHAREQEAALKGE